MARATREDKTGALFRVPPAAFTAARDRLVAELRSASRDADAKATARLRKPTVALWAANQAAHVNRTAVDDLLAAVRRLKQAHLGRGDLRGAIEAQRAALDRLTASAHEQLEAIGHAATPEIVARVSATVLASAVDQDAHDALRAGHLVEERAAPGFEAFGDGNVEVPPRAAPKRAPRPAAASPRANVVAIDEARRARHQAADAERAERARRRREADHEAARRARELQAHAERERAAVAEAEAAEAALRKQLEEARRKSASARRAAMQASRAARQARGGATSR